MTPNDSLRALVLRRRRRWLAGRCVESLLAGGGVAALTLAAARLSGAQLGPSALAMALLCALLAGASLLRERWRDELQFTRRFDARLGADGAIVTVCESGRAPAEDALVSLLALRTLSDLDGARLARASAPPSPLFAALCLSGLALLAWIGELEDAGGRAPLWEALAELELSVGSGSSGAAPQLQRALADLETARAAAGLAAAEERELERRLEALLAAAAPGSGSDRAGGESPQARGPGAAGGSREGAVGAGATAGEGPQGGSGEPTLAAGPAVRTMSRPSSPDPMHASTQNRQPPAPGAGPGPGSDGPAGYPGQRGRFWPSRHDAVVASFVEQSRRD